MEWFDLSNKQFEFLRYIYVKYNLDENVEKTLEYILENREYSKFHKNILKDLRSRYIREEQLHHKDVKWEDELNKANRE